MNDSKLIRHSAFVVRGLSVLFIGMLGLVGCNAIEKPVTVKRPVSSSTSEIPSSIRKEVSAQGLSLRLAEIDADTFDLVVTNNSKDTVKVVRPVWYFTVDWKFYDKKGVELHPDQVIGVKLGRLTTEDVFQLAPGRELHHKVSRAFFHQIWGDLPSLGFIAAEYSTAPKQWEPGDPKAFPRYEVVELRSNVTSW